MKTKTFKNIYHKFFNIYVILFALFSSTLFIEIAKNLFDINILDASFALSLSQIKLKKIWVLLSYGFYHGNWFYFLLCFLPLTYLTTKLKAWYSKYELGRFFVISYASGIISHLLLAPNDYMIYGSFGQVFAFLLLYTRFYGRTHFIKIRNISINVLFLVIIFIMLDFLTIGMQFRYNKGSFGSHLGIFIFFLIYIYTDKEKNSLFTTYDNHMQTDFPKTKDFHHDEKNTAPSDHEIDSILDKISQKGIHSITDEERRKLKTASKRKS